MTRVSAQLGTLGRRLAKLWQRAAPGDLEDRLRRIERASGGRLHVSAQELRTGRRCGYREADPVPMASTVKLPLAIAVLTGVDAGRLGLDDAVEIPRAEILEGEGSLDALRTTTNVLPISRSIGELLELALVESDNTAAHALVGRAGGPPRVQAVLASRELVGMRVDRSIAGLMADRPRAQAVAAGSLEAAGRAFLADPRDTTTPDAMVELLVRLQTGALLSRESTALLLRLMGQCRTSAGRIRAGAPPGSSVAHKTGTLVGAVAADVGLVTSPEGTSVALVIFLLGHVHPAAARDRAIAEAAHAVLAVLA